MRMQPREAATASPSTPTPRPASASDRFRPGAGPCSAASADEGSETAAHLLAELRSRTPESRTLAVADEPRFAHPELASRLVAEAHARRFDDPDSAVELARLAVEVARRVPPGALASAARLADLRAEVAAALANAQRVAGDPLAAEASFEAAREHLAAGTGDPLLAARVADLAASLAKDRQRFGEACELLESAIAAYRRAGQLDWVARALVKLGSVLLFEGRYHAALARLREAVSLLRPEVDRRTFVICAHNAVNCLNQTGYSIAARGLVADLRRLHQRLGDEINLLRLTWMEAEIDLELGLDDRAERALLEVRQGFLDRNQAYDAALTSLALAEIYARRRDLFRMRRLAEEMLPIFQSRSLHREALAALIVFREAVALRQANVALIRDVAGFLRRARRDRSLRFRPTC
jgi:tetratricopeptide (TPR) repeat protein